MDIVEAEIISAMVRAQNDCDDARVEELRARLEAYRNEMKAVK